MKYIDATRADSILLEKLVAKHLKRGSVLQPTGF